MKILDAKAAVDKEWKKSKTLPAWSVEKVKSKKEVILEAQREKKEGPLCHIDGHLSSQECTGRTEAQKIQRMSRARRRQSMTT